MISLALVGGCAENPASPSPTSSQAPLTSSPVVAQPSFDPAQVAEWTRFRQRYGLRSDLDWVLKVARDPSTFNEMSVPLLPAEIEAVAAANLSIQNLIPALAMYGETFQDEYAGTFIDGPRAVVQFTDRLDEHQADLAALFGGDAPVDVRGARYSLRQLGAFSGQVEAQRDWFATVDAELYGASPAELGNAVRVRYKASDDRVESAILVHFGRPDWMRLKWYGPLKWTGPRGTLRARVVDKQGRPVDADCVLHALDPAATAEDLPMATQNGICQFDDVPATDFEVEVSQDGRRTTSERVLVPPDGTATVTIIVNR